MSDLHSFGVPEGLWSARVDRVPAGDMRVGVVEESPADGAPRAGYGSCSQCSCAGFTKDYRNENVCERCGHSYGEHY